MPDQSNVPVWKPTTEPQPIRGGSRQSNFTSDGAIEFPWFSKLRKPDSEPKKVRGGSRPIKVKTQRDSVTEPVTIVTTSMMSAPVMMDQKMEAISQHQRSVGCEVAPNEIYVGAAYMHANMMSEAMQPEVHEEHRPQIEEMQQMFDQNLEAACHEAKARDDELEAFRTIVQVLTNDRDLLEQRCQDTDQKLADAMQKLAFAEHELAECSAQMNKLAECQERDRCVICLSQEADHIVLPCAHLALCSTCGLRNMDVCPVCRGGVHSIIRVYRP
jgi:hypothetical protein